MNPIRKHHQDYWLSLTIFALVAFGLVMIYSVSKYYSLQITDGSTDKYYLNKQLICLIVGLFAWVIFQGIDYRFWQKKSTLMLFLTLGLLFLPLLPFGHGGGVGQRWINLKIFSFQPAEVAKLTFIIYLSGWFSSKGEDLNKIKKMFLPFALLVAAISFLLLLQKDLGTLSIFVAVSGAIFIFAGAPIYQIFASGGIAGLLLWLAVKIEPYRMERMLTFLNPNNETQGAGYHIRNALIAIGSGGLFGLGFGQSKQKYLYLPEAHTDSIFAIISEELGFVRSTIIIILFAVVAVRGYKIAKNAPDTFSRLLAAGIVTWLTAQMFVNIGTMLSLLPMTGIPLPFISYGGSSLVVLLAAVGIVANVSKNQQIMTKLSNETRRK